MTSAPIIRSHPGVLATVLVVGVLGTFLSIGIGGAALIVLIVLLADWLLKSVVLGRGRSESAPRRQQTRPVWANVVLTLLAIAAAGGLIGLGAWFV